MRTSSGIQVSYLALLGSSGHYFDKLATGDLPELRRMMLVK